MPNFAWGYAWRGVALSQQGHLAEAVAALKQAVELEPGSYTILHFQGLVEAAAGNEREARTILARLEEESRQKYVCPYEIASVYVQLGESDKAFEWLEKGIDEQCDCITRLQMERWMDALRTDPRYAGIVARMAYPKPL